MLKIKPRVYKVTSSDFPLEVQIRAHNLKANRAVASHLRLFVNGVPTGTKQPKIKDDQDTLTIRYSIDQPPSPPVDITQTIDAFFDSKPPGNARYDITITSAGGGEEITTIRLPTINPGSANLTFIFR